MIKIKTCMKNPLNYIGEIAGICWNSDISDSEKNIERAKSCIKSGHGRVMEYVDAVFIVDEYSARCIRELGRHTVGVTYLQESTRYVGYGDFTYYNPFGKEESCELYDDVMKEIGEGYKKLLCLNEKKEDVANVLPLGMDTKIVWKINLRALVHFMNERLCSRAYKEMRQLCNEIKKMLSEYSDEWKWITDNYFVPKCKAIGYCTEERSCKMMPKGLDGLKDKIIKEYIESVGENDK